MIFKVHFFFILLFNLHNIHAGEVSANTCRSHFAQNDILSKLTSQEKSSLETAARSLAHLLGKKEEADLSAKLSLNASIQKFTSSKHLSVQELLEFKTWFATRILFYLTATMNFSKKESLQEIQRTVAIQRQKEETKETHNKINLLYKKYHANNLSEALEKAYYSDAKKNPTQKEDILFILDRYQQLEVSDTIYTILTAYHHHTAIKHFLNSGLPLRLSRDSLENTPLHISAKDSAHEDILKILIHLKDKAPFPNGINVRNKNGQTPLHMAAYHSNINILKLLLEAGADPTLQDNEGYLPLHFAAHQKDTDPEVIRLLLKNKASEQINALTYNTSRTPLSIAVQSRNLEVLKVLLEEGADTSIKDNRGQTALHEASQYAVGPIEILQLLIAANNGAQLNAKTDEGQVPFHIATKTSNQFAIQLLIQASQGAHLNLKDKAGNTPLHLAIYSSIEILELLIQAGVNPTLKNKEKKTAYDLMLNTHMRYHQIHKIEFLRQAMAHWKRTHWW